MKALKVFLVIFFCGQSTLAQKNGTLFLSVGTLKNHSYIYEIDQYRLEHFNPERFSNSDWKYHSGDDLSWKEPSFSDTGWNLFQTDFKLESIPSNKWEGIGWFRLKVTIDNSLFNKSLALVVTHYGASEIYWDGKLINQYGTPGINPDVEKKYLLRYHYALYIIPNRYFSFNSFLILFPRPFQPVYINFQSCSRIS